MGSEMCIRDSLEPDEYGAAYIRNHAGDHAGETLRASLDRVAGAFNDALTVVEPQPPRPEPKAKAGEKTKAKQAGKPKAAEPNQAADVTKPTQGDQ